MDIMARHLGFPNSHIRILFMDFSSAFNMVNKHLHCLQGLFTHRQYADAMVLWFKERSMEMNIRKNIELCCRGT